MKAIKQQIEQLQEILQKFSSDNSTLESIQKAGDAMVRSLRNKHKIIACGNGGSMCDAMHFCEELTGKFKEERDPLPAIAVSDPGYLSCAANDYGWNEVFGRYIRALGNEGDILLALSTSGNSENIIRGLKTAKEKGLTTIGLSGKDGGKMAALCDIEIRAPYHEYSDRTQEVHLLVMHTLIDHIEKNI